jgi:hypothetical protein
MLQWVKRSMSLTGPMARLLVDGVPQATCHRVLWCLHFWREQIPWKALAQVGTFVARVLGNVFPPSPHCDLAWHSCYKGVHASQCQAGAVYCLLALLAKCLLLFSPFTAGAKVPDSTWAHTGGLPAGAGLLPWLLACLHSCLHASH